MSAEPRRWIYLPAGWVFLVYALLAAAAAWWMRVYPAIEWVRDATILLPVLVAAALAAWLVAQLLWLFSDRNSSIFHGVYLALMACALLGILIFAREKQYTHDAQIAREITEARQALRRRAFEQAREALDAIAERRERMKEDRFLQYEGRVPPETLERMRAVDAEIIAGLSEAAERYEAVLARNEGGGPENWLRLGTREELEAERARHVAVYEAGRVYLEYLGGLEERYQSRLDSLELLPPADRYATAEMTRLLQVWTNTGALRIRELDVEISAVAIRAIDVLLRSWGSWRFDRATSRVVFDNGNLEMSFMQLLGEASELVTEQIELRRRIDRMLGESREAP